MKYNTELSTALLGESGLAMTAGWVQVYSVDPLTREYMQTTMEFLPVGVGLPALCYSDKPEQPAEGLAIIRSADDLVWEEVPDYRGLIAYSTTTGAAQNISTLGALLAGITLLAPDTEYDAWDGKKWVTDKDAQRQGVVKSAQQELSRLMSEADSVITILSDAVEQGMATEEESSRLAQWKKYRVLLSRLDVSTAPDIIWPDKPIA